MIEAGPVCGDALPVVEVLVGQLRGVAGLADEAAAGLRIIAMGISPDLPTPSDSAVYWAVTGEG